MLTARFSIPLLFSLTTALCVGACSSDAEPVDQARPADAGPSNDAATPSRDAAASDASPSDDAGDASALDGATGDLCSRSAATASAAIATSCGEGEGAFIEGGPLVVAHYMLSEAQEVRGLGGACADFVSTQLGGGLDVIALDAGKFAVIETLVLPGGAVEVSRFTAVVEAGFARFEPGCGTTRGIDNYAAREGELVLLGSKPGVPTEKRTYRLGE